MVRNRRVNISILKEWLIQQSLSGSHANYSLRLLKENHDAFLNIKDELSAYIEEAHDDARTKLRKGFEDDLSPFDEDTNDPAENYPGILHDITLKGYWGETLGGLLVEHLGAHGNENWSIPAFLFRFHDVEFQHLEEINQRLRDGEAYDANHQQEQRTGRTGDDILAFIKNDENVITHVLVQEAKCLETNNATKLEEAHKQISHQNNPPVSVRELIEILSEDNSPEANQWRIALLNYWKNKNAQRFNGIVYICGNSPVRPSTRISWMKDNEPHEKYSSSLRLEGIEVHMPNLDNIINLLYRSASNA